MFYCTEGSIGIRGSRKPSKSPVGYCRGGLVITEVTNTDNRQVSMLAAAGEGDRRGSLRSIPTHL